MNEMKDKVVLITGATSGIGFATAMYLAKLGANVVGTARHETDLVTELKKVGRQRRATFTGRHDPRRRSTQYD